MKHIKIKCSSKTVIYMRIWLYTCVVVYAHICCTQFYCCSLQYNPHIYTVNHVRTVTSIIIGPSFLFVCFFTAPEFQNNAKLASLQKVLQSDFFNAVREVYEHVYETVDLSGSPEVRANATAKVAYSAFGTY